MVCKAVHELHVLPPFAPYLVADENGLAGTIEANFVVAQQINAENLSDRRDAAALSSHGHACL